MYNFKNLPLHDAVVENIDIKWESSLVEINLYAFMHKNKRALPYVLKFIDVTEIQIPHNNPWGESVYINSVNTENNHYYIEMQSGDTLTIKSGGYSFDPSGL